MVVARCRWPEMASKCSSKCSDKMERSATSTISTRLSRLGIFRLFPTSYFIYLPDLEPFTAFCSTTQISCTEPNQAMKSIIQRRGSRPQLTRASRCQKESLQEFARTAMAWYGVAIQSSFSWQTDIDHWWVLDVDWWIGRLKRLEGVGSLEAVRICWKQWTL